MVTISKINDTRIVFLLISSKWFNTYHFSTYRMIITDDIEIVLVIVSDDLILFISQIYVRLHGAIPGKGEEFSRDFLSGRL